MHRVLQTPHFGDGSNRGSSWYDASTMEIQERTQEHTGELVSLTPAAAAKISALMAEETDV
jgi:hypothetical protein